MSFNITVTSDFAKSSKRLNKKYPSFKKDYTKLIESLKKLLFPELHNDILLQPEETDIFVNTAKINI